MDLGALVAPDAGPGGGSGGDAGPATSGSLVGAGGIAQRSWSWVSPLPTPYPVETVFQTAADDVWLVGDHGMVVRWNGQDQGEVVRVGDDASETLTNVWASGPADVWVAGTATANNPSGVSHWDGSGWTSNYAGLSSLIALWGSGPGDVWAVAYPTPAVTVDSNVFHWDGTAWNVVPLIGDIAAIGGTSATDVWAVGTGATPIMHFDGTAWTPAAASGGGPFSSAHPFLGVWGSGQADVWAYYSDTSATWDSVSETSAYHEGFAHWDGTGWSFSQDFLRATSGNDEICQTGACIAGTSAGNVLALFPPYGGGWYLNPDQPWSTAYVNEDVTGGAVAPPDALSGLPGGRLLGAGDGDLLQILGQDSQGNVVLERPFPPIQSRQLSINARGDVWSLSSLWDASWSSLLQRWDGDSWTTVDSPFGPDYLLSLSVGATGDAWVVTNDLPTWVNLPPSAVSAAWWSGSGWTMVALPPQFTQIVAGASRGSAFAINSPCTECNWAPSGAAQPARWDGSEWVSLPISAYVAAASSVRDDLAWFAGISTDGVGNLIVSRWDGASATTELSRPANGQSITITGIWSASDDTVWMSGYPTLRYDGTSWQEMGLTTVGVWGTGPNDVWMIEEPGGVVHWDGTSLTTVKQTDLQLSSIAGTTSEVWVSGARGATLRLGAPTDVVSQ